MATRLALATVASLCAGMAQAATVTVTDLANDPFAYATYLASIPSGKALVEDFEALGAGLDGVSGVERGSFDTAVGTVSTVGGSGSGDTINGSSFANTGSGLALRSTSTLGRSNSTLGGNWFMDSNDTLGLSLALNSGDNFNRIGFIVTDLAEEETSFDFLVNGEVKYSGGSLENGSRLFFEIDFGETKRLEDDVVLTFRHNRVNDGFSIDDVALATAPIPASALMLLAAVGGLGAMRRKKAAAAA